MEERRICIVCESWESGGIEGFLSNVLLHMDRRGLRVDIVAAKLCESVFTRPLKAAGVRFVELSGSLRRFPLNYKLFRQLLQTEHYDVVHLNAFQGMSLNYVRLAAEAGIPVRIVHSHNTGLRRSSTRALKLLIHAVSKRYFSKYATEYWACSVRAAQFLFPSNVTGSRSFQVIPNGIDIERFRRDQTVREQVRSRFGIEEGQLVIGHVGRLCYQKNQTFLLEVFAAMRKRDVDSVLLVVGGGDRSALEEKAERLGLRDRVIFCEATDHVERLFWAMDIFVFPSIFEGFGIVLIEAQAAGLPAVCSNRVPREASFLPSTLVLPLEDSAESWAEQVLCVEREIPDQMENIRKAGLAISDVSLRIRTCYIQ